MQSKSYWKKKIFQKRQWRNPQVGGKSPRVPRWRCWSTDPAGSTATGSRSYNTGKESAKQRLCPPKRQRGPRASTAEHYFLPWAVTSPSSHIHSTFPPSGFLTNGNYCSVPVWAHVKDPKHQAASAQPAPSHLTAQGVVTPALSHHSTDFSKRLCLSTAWKDLFLPWQTTQACHIEGHSAGIQLHDPACSSAPPRKQLGEYHQKRLSQGQKRRVCYTEIITF